MYNAFLFCTTAVVIHEIYKYIIYCVFEINKNISKKLKYWSNLPCCLFSIRYRGKTDSGGLGSVKPGFSSVTRYSISATEKTQHQSHEWFYNMVIIYNCSLIFRIILAWRGLWRHCGPQKSQRYKVFICDVHTIHVFWAHCPTVQYDKTTSFKA